MVMQQTGAMIVENKRGKENAANRINKNIQCEVRFESNWRASGGVPTRTGRRSSLIDENN